MATFIHHVRGLDPPRAGHMDVSATNKSDRASQTYARTGTDYGGDVPVDQWLFAHGRNCDSSPERGACRDSQPGAADGDSRSGRPAER